MRSGRYKRSAARPLPPPASALVWSRGPSPTRSPAGWLPAAWPFRGADCSRGGRHARLAHGRVLPAPGGSPGSPASPAIWPDWLACSTPYTAPGRSTVGAARYAPLGKMPRRSSDSSASPLAPCRVSRQVITPATTRPSKKTEEHTQQRRRLQLGYFQLKKTKKTKKNIRFHIVTSEPDSGRPRHAA